MSTSHHYQDPSIPSLTVRAKSLYIEMDGWGRGKSGYTPLTPHNTHIQHTHRYFNISCSWSHFPQITATTRQSSFLNHIFISLCSLPCFYVRCYLFVACFSVILSFIWLLVPFIDCLCSWCTWNMCVCVCVCVFITDHFL